MTDRDEIYKIRGRYSSAMGDYEAATDAVRQFDRDLFDGTLIDVGIIAREAQELKREEGENFDPTMWPLYFEELNGPRRMETIWDGLQKRGMPEDQLEKLMGLNLLRLYQKIYG